MLAFASDIHSQGHESNPYVMYLLFMFQVLETRSQLNKAQGALSANPMSERYR